MVAHGFVPVVGIGGSAAVIVLATRSKLMMIAVLGIVLAASFVAERIAPYEPIWNRSHRDRLRDAAHAVVNESSTALGVLAMPSIVGVVPHVSRWPAGLPFPVQVLASVVVLDLGITFVHWRSHRYTWLWRFHAVHHSVGRMYGFNGLVKHPVHQAIETGAGMLPLVAFAIPGDVAAALAGLVIIQLVLQHSNVDYVVGRTASRWFALNSGHRLHHVRRVPEGDVNFGLFLLVWDRMFGTFVEPASVGVGAGELGIAERPDYPVGYRAQLREPFSRRWSTNG